ncbi:uncharacterized protein LOC128858586 [Anastrepha ludens]|uniref:uncharacterized protein LOC128858586 n=1 Tax=Anastrepha ludens TaxID=28586 RepID=UPI0023B17B27|nr:uncharacterized protein LOC128858586 [Anastrepha ludens]
MNFSQNFGCGVVLCAANICIIIISGWALKWVEEEATLSRGMFAIQMLCGILGILSFTHPNGSLFNSSDACQLADVTTGIFLYGAATLAVISTFAHWKHMKIKKIVSGISVMYSSALLFVLSFAIDECYWIFGFAALIICNEFVLSRLITPYEISKLEFKNIELCFYEIFALNAVNEAAFAIR